MQIFTKTITVTQEDLDELNHVNNVCYVQWVNDIAREHWVSKATPDMCKFYFWVVIRHDIHYKDAAFLDDVLKLKTYASLSGVTSLRTVEIYNSKTNKLLVKAETKYCLIDAKTERPTRAPQDIIDLFQ